MSITPSHLRHALKQITKISSHPNVLAYKIQLQGASKEYLGKDSKSGGIALPSPSSASMVQGGTAVEEPSMMKNLAHERQSLTDAKAEKENSWEESSNKDVADRRFMGLAVLDTTCIAGFLWGKRTLVKS